MTEPPSLWSFTTSPDRLLQIFPSKDEMAPLEVQELIPTSNVGIRLFPALDESRTVIAQQPLHQFFTFVSVTRNDVNKADQDTFERTLRKQLLPTVQEESIETGFVSRADTLLAGFLRVNALAALVAVNQIFLENYNNRQISVQLALLVSRLPLEVAGTVGVTMATAALASCNAELVEAGIRAFERWSSVRYLDVLKGADIKWDWLASYRDEVVDDIEGSNGLAGAKGSEK